MAASDILSLVSKKSSRLAFTARAREEPEVKTEMYVDAILDLCAFGSSRARAG